MEIIQKIDQHLQKVSIVHVILISFSFHLLVMNNPKFEILDEIHFTNYLRWFMMGIDHTPYQLPGLSFVVSPFVYIIGDNWISWRFPIVLFGMVFLYFYYKVVEHIADKKTAMLTSLVLIFSTTIFVHSTLMLRDIPVLAMGFFSIYLYFKQKYYFMGIILGLSALIKESAIFFLLFIVSYEILHNRKQLFIRFANSLEKNSISILKKPIIVFMLIISSFLIPLTIYDNTINVLEYETKYPELRTWDKDGVFNGVRFQVINTTSELLEKELNDFNYVKKVRDPFHHISLLFFKGYYGSSDEVSNGFMASFLPIAPTDPLYSSDNAYEKLFIENNKEFHSKEFPYLWIQSGINYSWWHIGFYSSLLFIGYAVFDRVKNKSPISQSVIFIFCGLWFFIPYLLLDLVRVTFAYYMIYFLPIMAFGLISSILKIPKIRIILLIILFIAIIQNFIVRFPIWNIY